MNNDADDAVPWYQGIELFVAMRRLGKEMYFIDYNNDVHNPRAERIRRTSHAHAAVLRQQAQGRAGAGLDGARYPGEG
jgi:endo-alpha-1,4-polygalactosaminidase (GH114 family)